MYNDHYTDQRLIHSASPFFISLVSDCYCSLINCPPIFQFFAQKLSDTHNTFSTTGDTEKHSERIEQRNSITTGGL